MQNSSIKIDNFSFTSQLFELLCSENDNNEEDVCLISNNTLEKDHITLKCGHKYNYYSIFNEIKNQKLVQNMKEVQYLSKGNIKCPYCRYVQKGLLPSRLNYPNIVGVNWPKKLQLMENKCGYIFVSGKKKGTVCNKSCCEKYCSSHSKIIEKRLNKEKEKEDSSNSNQNEIILTPTTCKYIFKRGKNKGCQCSVKKLFKDGLCKQHYKNKQKKESKMITSSQNIVITV